MDKAHATLLGQPYQMRGDIPPLIHTSSCCGAWLRTGAILHLCAEDFILFILCHIYKHGFGRHVSAAPNQDVERP